MATIEDKYTKFYHNCYTQRVQGTIAAFLTALFQRYGFISQQQLSAYEKEVRAYSYNIADPLSTVYDMIDDLQLVGEAAGTPYTDLQLVSYATEILCATKDFDDGIKAWNRLTPAARTWAAFITHFDAEYKDLVKLRGPTMQSSNLHHANLVEQVKDSVERTVEASIQRHVTNATLATKNTNAHLPPALQNLPPGYTLQEIPPDFAPHAANATMQAPAWQGAMQAFFEKMDARLKVQEDVLKDISNRNQGGSNPSGGKGGYRKRKNTSKYCWTHGACAHDSKSCSNKKLGHQCRE